MVLHNSVIDDYHPTEGHYECRSCWTRTVSASHLPECPDCDGSVRNITVARERGVSRAIPHVIGSDD